MNRDKLFALGAYGIQAASTLGVVLAVSHMLAPAAYGEYSLVVATSQTAAVLASEWIRLAAVRFCSADSDDLPQRVATVQCTFIGVCLMLAVLALGLSVAGGLPMQPTLLGAAVAILLGATDLQLVFLRVRGSFQGFARLQAMRALILFLAPTLGAWLTRSASGALIGLSLGYLVSMAVFVHADPRWWRLQPALFKPDFLREMVGYGMAAAGASMAHSLVPMGLRWTGQATMSTATFAGFSLALDLLHKPFALVTTAIGGVLTPGVIQEYEAKPRGGMPRLRQLYEAQSWAVIVLLGGALAFLPDVAQWAVQRDLRDSFAQLGPWTAAIFAAHILVQTILATPGHLLRSGRALIGHAGLEVALTSLPCLYMLASPGALPVWWLAGVLAGVVLTNLWAIRLTRLAPCDRPDVLLKAGPVVLLVLGAFSQWPPAGAWPILLAKSATFLLVMVGAGAWLHRRSRRT
jgi:Polysaccharide biosynthesis protein